MSESDTDQSAELAALLDECRKVYQRASELVRSAGNPRVAFDAATQLTTTLRDLADSAARLRGEAVTAIWETEELSLAGLAKNLGLSKSRANQLIQAAKTPREEDE